MYAHGSGQWAKKIKGQTLYFGAWDDPAGALEAYREHISETTPELRPRKGRSLTIDDAVNHYLSAYEDRVEGGEISHTSLTEMKSTARMLIEHFGRDREVITIGPLDWQQYKAARSKSRNPTTLGNEITRIRTIMKWCNKSGLCGEVNFGPDFKKPSARLQRRVRNERARKLFEPEHIRWILSECGTNLRAMVLLGINGGLGPTDCAELRPKHIVDGWLDYPRTKTEVPRSIPLWPETLEWLRRASEERHKCKLPNVFVRRVNPNNDSPGVGVYDMDRIGKLFRAARVAACVPDGGFYWLRSTFETIGGNARDQVAVDSIMGHVDQTMAAVYRQDMDSDRLVAVTNHVREWLFG